MFRGVSYKSSARMDGDEQEDEHVTRGGAQGSGKVKDIIVSRSKTATGEVY